MKINKVDICCGLCWGDEAKGKIVSQLSKSHNYDFVCRWAGGSNAGHTIYLNKQKYKTHLIPSGVFYGITSVIGPDCVVNKVKFKQEIDYLRENGFNTELIKISPKCHIITDEHIQEDIKKYSSQGTTANGIAPCYRDKYARKGLLVKNDSFFDDYLWDEKLYGNVLCEGAQGVWLDINYGSYPYITSSTTLPYGACSLGFSPKLIKTIYGACKIYDTRVGTDPEFPEDLLNNESLMLLAKYGNEYGTTTGRPRKTQWLNMDRLIKSINISGTTVVIVSKVDVVQALNMFNIIKNNTIVTFSSLEVMKSYIIDEIKKNCPDVEDIFFSNDPETVPELIP